jgi:hypothetical protein
MIMIRLTVALITEAGSVATAISLAREISGQRCCARRITPQMIIAPKTKNG